MTPNDPYMGRTADFSVQMFCKQNLVHLIYHYGTEYTEVWNMFRVHNKINVAKNKPDLSRKQFLQIMFLAPCHFHPVR